MTANEFRSLALSMPEAIEGSHNGHPDFRVRHSDTKTRIFASLFVPFDEQQKRAREQGNAGGREWGMVKLTPQQQAEFIEADPEIFKPVAGGWGRQGATQVRLDSGSESTSQARCRAAAKIIRAAVIAAWRNNAPRRLVEDVD